MTEQSIILNRLLDKYENSKHLYDTGTSTRRVMLRVEKKDFPEYNFEDASIRDSYNEAAMALEKQRLVKLEWVNGRPLLSAIVLRLDQIMQCYVISEKRPEELVVYHGGFLSPQKRKLVTLIAQAASETIHMRFWADIDVGGFRMFDSLQKLIPSVVPMRMSGEFVDKYYEHGLARSEAYLSSLREDANNGKYSLFQDAIEKILNYGITIEQEIFLNE